MPFPLIALVLVSTCLVSAFGFPAKDGHLRLKEKIHHPTVAHFARHSLCGTAEGQLKFFVALKDHLHEISDDLTINFVIDLCHRNDEMLIKWVTEIFDSDHDGHIAHFEKEYHSLNP